MKMLSSAYSRKGSFPRGEETIPEEGISTVPADLYFSKITNARHRLLPIGKSVLRSCLHFLSIVLCFCSLTTILCLTYSALSPNRHSSITSMCYDWLSLESSICDSVSFYIGDATPLDVNEMGYSIHVLSVEKRAIKTKRNLHLLAPYQTTPGVYQNYDAMSPDEDIQKRNSEYIAEPVTPGEEGCILGHRRLLEDFIRKTDKDVALVLEDDAIPSRRGAILAQMEQLVEALDGINWDFVQLGRCWDVNCHLEGTTDAIATLKYGIHVYKSQGLELCSHAYIVSRNGAEKILQYTMPFVLPFVSAPCQLSFFRDRV